MQRLEVSGAVRPIYGSLGVKKLTNLMHKFLFYNKFILCIYMFRAVCAHHQEVKIVLYCIWYHHTCMWPSRAQVERGLCRFRYTRWLHYSYTVLSWCSFIDVLLCLFCISQPVHRTATYRFDDTRCCIIRF